MKIIKPGVRPQDREAEFVCRKCEAVISAKLGEGKYAADRDGTFITFICPCCNDSIHVSEEVFK